MFGILGVMPPQFEFPAEGIDVWVPDSVNPDNQNGFPRGEHRHLGWQLAMARLKPGVSIEQAQEDMDRVAGIIAERFAGYPENQRLTGAAGPPSLKGRSYRGAEV